LFTAYRTAVHSELAPKIGEDATRSWLINLAWRLVLFLIALACVIVALLYKETNVRYLTTVGAVLVVALVGAVAVFLWTREKYVRALAEFLKVERRVARKVPLRSPAYERWMETERRSPKE
jgi:RsiW-degrading membrane proteinase PrsW (M82 family)